MHLSRLMTSEMIALSQSFLDPAHAANQALAGMPELSTLLLKLSEAHQVLVASQSADDLRASSLQKEIGALAEEHDCLARGIDHLCQGLSLLSEEEQLCARWARLHQLLLPRSAPRGASSSPQTEAENAALLQQILEGLPAPDKGLLKAHFIGKRSLFELIENYIALGVKLGEKELERQSVPVSPTDDALQGARSQWARTLGAMASMLHMSELLGELPPAVNEHVLAPLRAATERRPPRPVAAESA